MLRTKDTYLIIANNISDDEKQKLTILYQPIIGPIAVNLYLFLVDEVKLNRSINMNFNHWRWKAIFGLPLSQIEKERNKLEAIGLIDTFVQEKDQKKEFVYQLYSPVSAKKFLQNTHLKQLLLNAVGKTEYERLCFYFAKNNFDLSKYKKISVNFNYLLSKNINKINYQNNFDLIDNFENRDLQYYCDFNLIEEKLTKYDIDVKTILTPKNQLTLEHLASLYNLTINQLIIVIIDSLDDEKKILNLDLLTKKCEMIINKDNTELIYTPEQLLIEDNESKSLLAQKIFEMKTLSPYEYLFLLKNNKPTNGELELLAMLLNKYQLFPSVVNCLLDYVWIKNNKNLVFNYLHKIAETLQKENIISPLKAIKFFKKLYINSKIKKSIIKKPIFKESVIKEEIIPEWWANKEEITITKTENIDWETLQEKLRQI